MKEALARLGGIELAEVNEDAWKPKVRGTFLRGVNRLLGPAYQREMLSQFNQQIDQFRPAVLMTYKGHSLGGDVIKEVKARGIATVNLFPDYSPHAYGADHKRALGEYDLVISTKPFHPRLWKALYGYDNPCEFVPQGYDPVLHLDAREPAEYRCDLGLVATWRLEYGVLMEQLAKCLGNSKISVEISGHGWKEHRMGYPSHWSFPGPITGRGYIDWLRGARICLSPVMRHVVIDGQVQPGDEDTTRTYELAAGKCFVLHRRTDYVQTIYDENGEVPMYDSPQELAALIARFLPDEQERRRFANAAHRRAVPAYSLDARAAETIELIKEKLGVRS